MQLLPPFATLFREMLEMRYLWHEPVQLDNAKPTVFPGAEPHTPLVPAAVESLAGLGSLPEAAAPATV